MIEKTSLTELSVRSLLKKKYGIEVNNVKKIDKGSANIFLINNKYILKEFQSIYTKEEIKKEVAIIKCLKMNNLPVPNYIKTISGKYYFVHNKRIVILQEYIKGQTKDRNKGDMGQILECAREYGELVLALETLKYKLPEQNFIANFLDEKIDKSIAKFNALIKDANGKYKERIIKDLSDKIDMLNGVRGKYNIEDITKTTFKNSHGDYNVLQFIYCGNKIKAIIDFATACKMPIIWEIIRAYSLIDKDCDGGSLNIEHLILYIKEVCKYVKLNKYDLKYMVIVYLTQLLNSDFGYKQYIEDNSKKDLLNYAFFRTNLCRFLFKNEQEITKRLLTEAF